MQQEETLRSVFAGWRGSLTEEKHPYLLLEHGGGGGCQSSLKKDRIDWEAGCFQSTWNYGPGDLNGGRAEIWPFFLLQGSTWMIMQRPPAVSQRAVFLNGRRNSRHGLELVWQSGEGFFPCALEGMDSEAETCHSSKTV